MMAHGWLTAALRPTNSGMRLRSRVCCPMRKRRPTTPSPDLRCYNSAAFRTQAIASNVRDLASRSWTWTTTGSKHYLSRSLPGLTLRRIRPLEATGRQREGTGTCPDGEPWLAHNEGTTRWQTIPFRYKNPTSVFADKQK